MLKLFSLGGAVVGLSLATLWTPMAEAQEATMQQLRDCAAIENPLQRLVCYDKLVAGDVPRQQVSSRATATEKAEPQSAEQRFGLAEEADKEVIYVALAKVDKDPYGKVILHLTNGQVWKQLDSTSMQLPLDADYRIEQGVLSSFYFVREGFNKRISVKRIK